VKKLNKKQDFDRKNVGISPILIWLWQGFLRLFFDIIGLVNTWNCLYPLFSVEIVKNPGPEDRVFLNE